MSSDETRRLTMNIANVDDLSELEEIEKECNEYFQFDPPSAAEQNRSLRECLMIGDIIPGIPHAEYKKKNYRLYSIRSDNILVGWLSYYLEYQQKDTVYLSVLYVKEAARKEGVGLEILNTLVDKLASTGFKTIRLHCSLRNATALRFWVKNGFNHIVDIECDGNLYPENFGGIELMKIIV